jgi:bacterial/archaeal transporter family-2 protein
VQVYAGLTLVNKVGAGPFVGFTVTAALITSLLIDHFAWFRMQAHPLNTGRIIGGLLLIGGISLIAKF